MHLYKIITVLVLVIACCAQRGNRNRRIRGRGGNNKRALTIPSQCLSEGNVCTEAAACVFNVGSTCAKDLLDFDEAAKGLDDQLQALEQNALQWDKERFLKRHEIMESEFVKCLETYISKSDLDVLGAMCPTTASRKKREVDLSHVREKRRSRNNRNNRNNRNSIQKTAAVVKPDVEFLPIANPMRKTHDIKQEMMKLDENLWAVCNYSSCMDLYKQSCISKISSRAVDAWEFCTRNNGDIVEVMRDIEMEEEDAKSCREGKLCNMTEACIAEVETQCQKASETLKTDFDDLNAQLKATGHIGRSWAPAEWEKMMQQAESNFQSCLNRKLSRNEKASLDNQCALALGGGSRKKRSTSTHFAYLHRVKRRARRRGGNNNNNNNQRAPPAVTAEQKTLLDAIDDIEKQMGDACCDYACWVPFKESCVPLVSDGAVKDWDNCEQELEVALQKLIKH